LVQQSLPDTKLRDEFAAAWLNVLDALARRASTQPMLPTTPKPGDPRAIDA
jgi:hypothetical protein